LNYLSKLNFKNVLRVALNWFPWQQTQTNFDSLAMFTAISGFLNKLQQKQCDFTLNFYSF